MFAKRIMVATAGALLLGSTPLVVSSTAGADQATKVVHIVGQNSFQADAFFLSTYRFDQRVIKVHQGQQVQFDNKTVEPHSITLVAAADLPRTVNQVLNNCTVCNNVNNVYFPNNAQKPAGAQIDNGKITDDTNPDADLADPAVPSTTRLNALVEDFDTPATATTVGDSTLIGVAPKPNQRTIVVTAAPGTVLHYFCTFHPWMQATIVVTAPAA
jgi:plastocyanin